MLGIQRNGPTPGSATCNLLFGPLAATDLVALTAVIISQAACDNIAWRPGQRLDAGGVVCVVAVESWCAFYDITSTINTVLLSVCLPRSDSCSFRTPVHQLCDTVAVASGSLLKKNDSDPPTLEMPSLFTPRDYRVFSSGYNLLQHPVLVCVHIRISSVLWYIQSNKTTTVQPLVVQ